MSLTTLPEVDRIEEILNSYRDQIGVDYKGYKNHCVRIIRFLNYLKPISSDEYEKLLIAVAFHDIGLWTHDTFDYLPPSVCLLKKYLTRIGKTEWIEEISLMIDRHHKFTAYQGKHELVELFRKADLVDFSLGLVNHGISKDYISRIKKQFPNEGFHKMLLVRMLKWVPLHPFRPIPMFKF